MSKRPTRLTRELAANWCQIFASNRLNLTCDSPPLALAWWTFQRAGTKSTPECEQWAEAEARLRDSLSAQTRRHTRYAQSTKAKARQREYKQSEKGRANYRRAQSKYHRTAKGRATRCRWYEKRGRDYLRDYQTSRIMRHHKERWRKSEAGKAYRLFYHLSGEAAADQRRHRLRKIATIPDSKWSIIERKFK